MGRTEQIGQLRLIAGTQHPPGKPRALDDSREGRVDDPVPGEAKPPRPTAATRHDFTSTTGAPPSRSARRAARPSDVVVQSPADGGIAVGELQRQPHGDARFRDRLADRRQASRPAAGARAWRTASCPIWCMASMAMRWATACENLCSRLRAAHRIGEGAAARHDDAARAARVRRFSEWTPRRPLSARLPPSLTTVGRASALTGCAGARSRRPRRRGRARASRRAPAPTRCACRRGSARRCARPTSRRD